MNWVTILNWFKSDGLKNIGRSLFSILKYTIFYFAISKREQEKAEFEMLKASKQSSDDVEKERAKIREEHSRIRSDLPDSWVRKDDKS